MAKKAMNAENINLDEVYRQLRTNIEFSQMDDTLKVINIVSTNPNEGKSSIARNLARIFADKYKKVLLVDCDLRNPSLNKQFHVSNAMGLTNLLARFKEGMVVERAEEIQHLETGTENSLYFLSAGIRVPDPTEMLSSHRFSNFIETVKNEFDVVILDCPPVFAVADAIPLSNVADGTLFVLSSKDTNKADAKEAVGDLQRNGANIIGVVMTKVPGFKTKHYYGYGGYGGYGQKETV